MREARARVRLNRTALLGAVGAVGLVIQIVLGFAVAGTAHPTESAILVPHVVIGVAGLALVAYLTLSIFRSASLGTARLVYGLTLLLTLAQVALGYGLILGGGAQGILMAHEGVAVLILILMAAGGMVSARARRMAAQPSQPQTSPS